MITRPLVLGNHAFLFPEGAAFTSPEEGIASRDAKPDAAETTWIDPGIVENLKVSRSFDEVEIFAPSPGQLRLYDVIETKKQLNFTLSLKEWSVFAFQLLFGTRQIEAATRQYNPLAGLTTRAWVKLQQYDQNDELFNTVDVFCFLKIDGDGEFNPAEAVSLDLLCRTLHSRYNTGVLAAPGV